MTLDPASLHAPNLPAEWQLPDALRERFFPGKIVYTADELAEIERIINARWYLIRNEIGATCGRCGKVHPYLTLHCLERPFNGLDQLLLLEDRLTEEQAHRHGAVERVQEHVQLVTSIGAIEPIRARDAQMLLLRIQLRTGHN